MKKNYKKILYLLGLTSMLSLTACNRESEEVETIESVNECLENHLDEEKIQILELSDGSKYVKDSDVFYATRERFLNNNSIYIFEPDYLNYEYYEKLEKNNEYLYLLNNTEVRNHITCFMQNIHKNNSDYNMADIIDMVSIYEERENWLYLDMTYKISDENFGDTTYNFEITHNLVSSEQIDIEYNTDKIRFNKYLHFDKLGNDSYRGIEQYILTSKENKSKIELYSKYYLDKNLISEGNYTCDNERLLAETAATLNNGVEEIEINISEEKFEQMSNLLIQAVKQNMDVEQLLDENKELMIEIFGEDYQLFFTPKNKIYTK